MRIFTLIVCLFVYSFSYAQTEMIEAIVADYERAKSLSVAYVEAMPENDFSYKPTDDVRTFAEQFLHASQGMIGLSANGTGLERIYPDENLEKNDAYKTKEEVKRLVIESYDFAIRGIKEMDPTTLNEVVPRGQFQVTRIGWINKALEHYIHHRGQAAVYLRMNGIVPPQFQLF